MKLDKVYEEKVYAGVLGKLIGVYLGRPFEQWSHERVMEELGEINYWSGPLSMPAEMAGVAEAKETQRSWPSVRDDGGLNISPAATFDRSAPQDLLLPH